MKCPYCKSSNTSVYYSVPMMPNILAACPNEWLDKVKMYPFEASLCMDCLLGFNSSKVKDEEISFIYDNYLYISPCRGIGATKYAGMRDVLKKSLSLSATILEIGCSEGYLLNELEKAGYNCVMGVEPGPQALQAQSLGLNVVKGYFDEQLFSGKLFDGIIMMHVFEHLSDPFLVLKIIKNRLAASGKLFIEVPELGGYHHHHLFFYTLSFFRKLCADNGFKIVEFSVERHLEDTLRFVIMHVENLEYPEVNIAEEATAVVALANKKFSDFKNTFVNINKFLSDGVEVVWWGAGSASTIWLNQLEERFMSQSFLTIVDGDHKKWGMCIPGVNLTVSPFTILRGRKIKKLIIASILSKEIYNTININGITVEESKVFF